VITLDQIKALSADRFYANAADIDAAETTLGTRLPTGYREYISQLGEGVLASYIRVYPPYQILEGDNGVHQWRKRVEEYYFWEPGRNVLAREHVLECIIVADTMDGDELVAHPSTPDRLYVLPRHEEMIFIAGDGLLPAIEWLLTSGTLTEPIDSRVFEPYDGRVR
jgi:hypothetical protein